jgi:hypothetical protein
MILAATQLNDSAQLTQTPESLHRSGASQLITGRVEDGVLAIEDSILRATDTPDVSHAIEETTDAGVLSDLTAGYLARADDEESLDLLAAINSAERAWSLARTPEIAWNRALALSAAASRDAALAGWRDYLALDPGSQWSTEARRRMESIDAAAPVSQDAVRRSLMDAVWSASDDAVIRAVAGGPGIARAIAEDELLPAWGAGNDTALGQARRIGAAVSRITGDFTTFDTAAKIDRLSAPDRAKARAAMVSYGTGRQVLRSFTYAKASEPLKKARTGLELVDLPLAARAGVWEASAEYQMTHVEKSLALCAEAVRRAPCAGRALSDCQSSMRMARGTIRDRPAPLRPREVGVRRGPATL